MNPDDAISLFAELAVALTGFAGVASAFSGRNRDFGEFGRIRLVAIVELSASVLVGCLVYISASVGNGDVSHGTRLAGVACFLMTPFSVRAVPNAIRQLHAGNYSGSAWTMYSAIVLTLVESVLFLLVAVDFGEVRTLFLGFSLQLLHTVWLFLRLLTKVD